MNSKQIIAVLMPILLIAVMYPVFQLLARRFGNTVGWYSGLAIYWFIWGFLYPVQILGKEKVLGLIQPQRFDLGAVLLASIPIVVAAVGRFQFGMQYEKATIWAWFGLLATAVGNGFFEEVLWRGTYMELFPDNTLLRIFWPSLWFGLWHYAPGSVSNEGSVLGLMVAGVFFGLLLSFLAKRTDTLWWSILSHTLAGIVMVI